VTRWRCLRGPHFNGHFFCTYLLLGDYRLALTAAALTLFNNFLFVMSRVAMLDVFYFAFVMWGVLRLHGLDPAGLEHCEEAGSAAYYWADVWPGDRLQVERGVTLAAVALVAVVLYARNTRYLRQVGTPTLILALVIFPIVAYSLAFWPLCRRFHLPFTVGELLSLNAFIWRYHVNCAGNPALDSRWYHWLFRSTPERGLSYLMGNFVVVWGGLLALLICAWRFCRSLALPEGLVTMFYAVNLLQRVVIPQQRTVYYHYYPSAMFLGVAIAIAISRSRRSVSLAYA